MWKAIADKAKSALLDVLLDRIEELFLGNLVGWKST